jgi:hypothetical protein
MKVYNYKMAKCCILINAKQYFFYSLKLSCKSLQISFFKLSIKLKREEVPELRTAEEQTTQVVEFCILRRKSLIAQTFHE